MIVQSASPSELVSQFLVDVSGLDTRLMDDALIPWANRFYQLFFSDVHGGIRDGSGENRSLIGSANEMLRNTRAEEIHLVGDILQWARLSKWNEPEYDQEVRTFFALLQEHQRRGARIIWYDGNHDRHDNLVVYDWKKAAEQVAKKSGPFELANHQIIEMDGKRYLITHGNSFDPKWRLLQDLAKHYKWVDIHSWGDLPQPSSTIEVPLNLMAEYGLHSERDAEGRRVLMTADKASGLLKPLQAFEDAAVHRAKEMGVDGIICGHVHHPGDRMIDGIHYMNTGCFLGEQINSTIIATNSMGGKPFLAQWHIDRLSFDRNVSFPIDRPWEMPRGLVTGAYVEPAQWQPGTPRVKPLWRTALPVEKDRRQLIIFDFDTTLYPPGIIPLPVLDDLGAAVAMKLFKEKGHTLTRENALALARHSFETYHDSVGSFVDYAKKNGINPEAIQQPLFDEYHKALFKLAKEKYPRIFVELAKLRPAFEQSDHLFERGISTHASVEHWIKPALKEAGLLGLFNPNLSLGLDDNGFERKHLSASHIESLLAQSGYRGDQAVFVEDVPKNLVPAWEQFGVRGAILHHGRTYPDAFPTAVHYVERDAAELLNTLRREMAPDIRSNKIRQPVLARA